MFNNLQSVLKSGKYYSIEELTSILGGSHSSINARIEHLENAGVLRRVSFKPKCCGRCQNCKNKHHADNASGIKLPEMWELAPDKN